MLNNLFAVSKSHELFAKFSSSWIATIALTVATPSLEFFYPIISQILLILFVQIIAFFVDFARLKWLNERRKTTIKQIENKIEINSQKEE